MGETKSCKNCRWKRSGECFGKSKICKDYKYAPSISEEQARSWPKEMRHREVFQLPMRKEKQKVVSRKQTSSVSRNSQFHRKPKIELYETADLNLHNFLLNHQNEIVIFGYGKESAKTNIGYYRVAMVSKMHMRYIEGSMKGSADRNLLQGIAEAVQRIKKSTPIHLLITTHIGLGNSYGRDWTNADIYKKIEDCIAIKKCKMTVGVLTGKQEQIRELLLKQNREKYFTVLPDVKTKQ